MGWGVVGNKASRDGLASTQQKRIVMVQNINFTGSRHLVSLNDSFYSASFFTYQKSSIFQPNIVPTYLPTPPVCVKTFYC